MEHFIDIYKKKPEYCERLLDLPNIKVNLKVDGKPFQVVYNENTDKLEFHGRSGNETTIGPLIDDYTRLFSKPINTAIAHVEPRKEVFKKYKFLTFEVIDDILLLTAVIDKNDKFIESADEIKKIADELDTDVMPTLYEGKLDNSQKQSIIDILNSGIVPEKQNFIDWVTSMFGTYKTFPKKLISASEEFIEGIVFFFPTDSKIIEYKLVDPTYRQSMKDRDTTRDIEREKNAEHYTKIYNIMVDWLDKNASTQSDNMIQSLSLNFINMINAIGNELLKEAKYINHNTSDRYSLQLDRVNPDIKNLINKYGQNIKDLLELYFKTFYKKKKRGFIIDQEFQYRINSIIDKMEFNKNENTISLVNYIKEALSHN